ncbi:hypothetical protein GQ42DRAFT_155368 [Ramicandelaber brevisporus]|nr:hypothetical protein GQ42DRAFT_155368 [Ramicandelaber brevisporus]
MKATFVSAAVAALVAISSAVVSADTLVWIDPYAPNPDISSAVFCRSYNPDKISAGDIIEAEQSMREQWDCRSAPGGVACFIKKADGNHIYANSLHYMRLRCTETYGGEFAIPKF